MTGIRAVVLRPGYWISSVIKGHGGMSGLHHRFDSRAALADMAAFIDAGVTTIDCGCTDPSIERLAGSFLQDL